MLVVKDRRQWWWGLEASIHSVTRCCVISKVNGTCEGETVVNEAAMCCVDAPRGGDVSVGTRTAAAHAAAGGVEE